MTQPEATIGRVAASAYEIPTDAPEADGTIEWDSTTLVVVTVEAGGKTGLGYTYSDASIVSLIESKLAEVIARRSALDIPGANAALWRGIRNFGRSGLGATAISAVDAALWDVKAKLLGVPVVTLLGRCRDSVAIYGSGGFTSYSDEQLRDQLAGWVERDGCRAVKMKIGAEPGRDPDRVKTARGAIGDAGLFVDANGAFSAKQALALAHRIAEYEVTWFEEPVSSDDIAGILAQVRSGAPAGMDIAAGEYGYTLDDFRRWLPVGRCAAGRCDAMWRGHRLYAGRRAVRGAARRSVGPLRPGAASPCGGRRAAPAAPRMVSRSRPHRADAVRRGARAARRQDRTRPLAARFRTRIQGARRRTLSGAVSRMMRAQSSAGLAFTSFATAAAAAAIEAAIRPQSRTRLPAAGRAAAATGLDGASALLAAAALADSGVEHYRGAFHNKTMFLPLAVASAALGTSLQGATDRTARPSASRDLGQMLAVVTGIVGTGFHFYNILKRPGGWSWLNLFYAAPIGAPAALSLAGMLGGIAERLRGGGRTMFGFLPGRLIARLVSLGLLGASGEAALMHFRGAYHNPAMVIPITAPPLAAALLTGATICPRFAKPASKSLRLLTGVGFLGAAFHAYGIQRNMGGWRNWSQNILNGPPLPAPPAFTALAMAGLAALKLMERER